ncbi:hypothetical protein [Haloprofundus salilacus]|uniref:hypothetical protein n=1 Tax=Haloprofundus salilacus TaxID=2876190 RepID=UPI001CCCAA52|nr:hypothetical protein [Haloprofundus salilacus]
MNLRVLKARPGETNLVRLSGDAFSSLSLEAGDVVRLRNGDRSAIAAAYPADGEVVRHADIDAPWVMTDGAFRINLGVNLGNEVSATTVDPTDAERSTFAMPKLPATPRIEEMVHNQLRSLPVELGQTIFLRKGVGERYRGGPARVEATTPDAPVRITADTEITLTRLDLSEW